MLYPLIQVVFLINEIEISAVGIRNRMNTNRSIAAKLVDKLYIGYTARLCQFYYAYYALCTAIIFPCI